MKNKHRYRIHTMSISDDMVKKANERSLELGLGRSTGDPNFSNYVRFLIQKDLRESGKIK